MTICEWLEVSRSAPAAEKARLLRILLDSTKEAANLRRSRRVRQRVRELLEQGDGRVVRAALIVLGRVRVPDSPNLLIQIVRRRNLDRRVRCLAVRALGLQGQGNEEAARVLLAVAASEEEPVGVREFALRALGEVGSATTVSALIAMAAHADWRIRWAATQGLASVSAKLSLPYLQRAAQDPAIPPEIRRRVRAWYLPKAFSRARK
jgi:HEAT repeat protein